MLQTTKLQRLFFFLFGAILCQNLQAQTISCPGNLLLNPSFEITSTNITPPPINTFYTPASWAAPQRCYADHDWLRPDGIGHIGLFGTGNSVASQNVTVTVGNFYSLTLYSAMHVPLVNQGRAVLQYYDASNNPIGTGVQHTVTHDWDVDSTFAGPYSLALPAAPANASYVRVTLENQNPTASGESVKFDALCLTTAAPINISGNVFNDANGLADNIVNGTGTNGGGLFANLVDANGNVYTSTGVSAGGAYSFTNVPQAAYSIILTTTSQTVGAALSTATLPAGYVATGENNCGTTAGCTGSDGAANSILSLGTVSANITDANFGIAQAGYIYIHKKAIDELSSKNFTFNISGGPISVGTILLNDSSETNIPVQDIGASQNGRLWAVGLNNNILYYRDAGTAIWIATAVTNAERVDGGQGNDCYYVTTTNNVRLYDAVTNTNSQIYSGALATDVGCAWDGLPYIVANSGALYHYIGSGNGTHGSATWPQVGSSTNNTNVDGNPTTGDAIVSKTDRNVWRITSAGTATSLGRPTNAGVAANANDIAVDANGAIFSVYSATSSVTSSPGSYPFKWVSGTTWSTDETTGGNATPNSGKITAGIGGQAWLVEGNTGPFLNGIIFSRTNNNGTIYWYDNDWVRTGSAITNAEMIPVVPGTYTLTETLPSGWDLTAIDIYDPSNNSSGVVATQVSTLNVAAGEVVHVNYTNQQVNTVSAALNCATDVVENFGSGTNTFGNPLSGITSYHYQQANKVDDGYYTLQKSSSAWPNTTITDHTGLTNGYFLSVNASFTKNEFYRKRVTGLIVGASYTLSFWAADLSPTVILRPNVTLGIGDINSGATINSVNTGSITSTSWQKFSFVFTATNGTVDLFIANNGQGGYGNDIAIDDIAFNLTPITTPVTTVIHSTCAASGSITVTSPVGVAYEYSINGTTFQSSTSFTNMAPGIYTVTARYAGSTCTATKQDTVKAAICGNVFNDANGLTDNTVNGTGTNVGGTLKMVLYDVTSGKVMQVVNVASDGTYSFLTDTLGHNYSLYLTTTTPTLGQAAVPVTTLPLGWVSTGENLGAGAGNDGTVNSILNIGVVNANVTNVNFGIEQPPTAGSGIQNGGNNPGGTTQVTVNANSFTNTAPSSDPSPGGVTAIRITSFPTGATTIVINGVSYTSGTFPVGGVMVPTNASGQPTQTITVDPTFNGSGSVTIPFVAVDAAGKESDNTGTAVINFSNTISGNVYNDANGLTDNTVNGTGTNAGGLNAVLIDANTGLVVASTTVAANGTYNFSGVNDGNYTVLITTNTATVGNTPPAVALPAGWISTGENLGAGAGNDGTVNGILPLGAVSGPVTNANFGIERLPSANAQSQTVPYPTGNVIPTGSLTTAVSGTDPEDGSMGNGNTVKITQLPTGTTQMYYDADGPGGNPPVLVTLNQQIPNFNPANLSFTNIPNGTSSIVFNYAFVDAAGLTGTPATYTINWAGVLPISLHGFSAQVLGCNNVSLRWQVSNAINFSHFELQRSIDGTNFNTITTIAYSNASLLYLYMDGGLEKGQYQYRLKLVDMDGRYSYGPSINSNVTCASKGIVLQPNPARENVTITGLKSGATVMFYDIANKLVLSKKATGSQLQLLLHNIAPGNYNVVVLNEAGIKIDTKPLVKLNN